MKAAGCELRGLHAIAGAGIHKLAVPLCCVVDFLGWRLVAVALLPIDAHTLVYGSDDCGATIACSDDEVNSLMRQLGVSLNISEHAVRCRQPPHNVCRLSGPADLEVHRGHDGRIYCLDAARIMPPQNPFAIGQSDPAVQRPKGFLYDLFRVEFVSSFSETPLSSDAFSGFGRAGHPVEENKIAIADTVLRTVVIPEVSKKLAQRYNGLEVDLDLVGFFHRHGINMRFLGLVRKEIKRIRLSELVKPEDVCSDALVMTLAGEMVARSAKHVLRARLRDCHTAASCRRIVVPFFNELTLPTFTSSSGSSSGSSSSSSLSSSTASSATSSSLSVPKKGRNSAGDGDALWNTILTDTERRFECALEGDTQKSRRSLVDVTWVRARLSEAVGVQWKPYALDSAIRSLRERDFVALRPLTKELSLVSGNFGQAKLRQAVALLKGAERIGASDGAGPRITSNNAGSSPDDNRRAAISVPAPTDVLITSLAQHEKRSRAAIELLSEAVNHFSMSLEARPSDVSMLLGRAVALSYKALTTAFHGHSKDALFDEAQVGFEAAARLARTLYKRSKNKTDHARWVSIRLSAGIFYARESVCRAQNDPKLAWMSAAVETKACGVPNTSIEHPSNTSSKETAPSLPVAYRLDVSSSGVQKSKQLVSIRGLRGNINPNLIKTQSTITRVCHAARRALDILDDFAGKGDHAGHSESTLLLWRASALYVLVLHDGGSDKGATRKTYESIAEELENTLHCAYASAMRAAENKESTGSDNDTMRCFTNAATAAVQLGWYFLTAHRRDFTNPNSPCDPAATPLLRGRRALYCAGRALAQLWALRSAAFNVQVGECTRAVTDAASPLFHCAVALASRVEHGLAGFSEVSSKSSKDATLFLERAVQLLRFPGNKYIDHMAIASLPTPSLVDTHQGPCAQLLVGREVHNCPVGDPTVVRLSDALLQDSIRPQVKTVTLFYGNSVQSRNKQGAAWSMFVATKSSDIDNQGPNQSGNLVTALINMVGGSQDVSYGARHDAPSQVQKAGSRRFDYYRKKHPLIDYVEYELHPTFPRPRRRKVYPPFSLHGGSWGIFQVSVTVGFRPPFSHVQVPLEFILSHTDGGVCHSIDVQLVPWGDVGGAHRVVSKGEARLEPDRAVLLEELKKMESFAEAEVNKRGSVTPRSQTKGRSQRKFTMFPRKVPDKLTGGENFTRGTASSRVKAAPWKAFRPRGLILPRKKSLAPHDTVKKAGAKNFTRGTASSRAKAAPRGTLRSTPKKRIPPRKKVLPPHNPPPPPFQSQLEAAARQDEIATHRPFRRTDARIKAKAKTKRKSNNNKSSNQKF
jgi:hypothetical protein